MENKTKRDNKFKLGEEVWFIKYRDFKKGIIQTYTYYKELPLNYQFAYDIEYKNNNENLEIVKIDEIYLTKTKKEIYEKLVRSTKKELEKELKRLKKEFEKDE